jgi:hypothetical protein
MIVLILSVSRRIKDASDDTMMLGRNCFIQGIKKSAAPTAGGGMLEKSARTFNDAHGVIRRQKACRRKAPLCSDG